VVADTGDAAAVQHVFDEIGERWNGELDERWREAFDDSAMGMVHCTDFT
jgi:hypothetical protein